MLKEIQGLERYFIESKKLVKYKQIRNNTQQGKNNLEMQLNFKLLTMISNPEIPIEEIDLLKTEIEKLRNQF